MSYLSKLDDIEKKKKQMGHLSRLDDIEKKKKQAEYFYNYGAEPKRSEVMQPKIKPADPNITMANLRRLDEQQNINTPKVQQPKVAPVSIYDDNAISMGGFQKLQQQQNQQSNNNYGAARESVLNAIQNADRTLLDDIKDGGKAAVNAYSNFAKNIYKTIGLDEDTINKVTAPVFVSPWYLVECAQHTDTKEYWDKALQYTDYTTANLAKGMAQFQRGLEGVKSFQGAGVGATNPYADENIRKLDAFIRAVDEQKNTNIGGLQKFYGEMLSSIGNMVPSIATGLLNPALGKTLFAMSAGGNNALEAKQAGASVPKSLAYGALGAGLELGTEALFGLYNPLFKGSLDDLIEAAIKGGIKSTAGQTLVKYIAGMVGEGTEEVISGLIDPWLKKMTYAPDHEVDYSGLLYDFLMGGAVSGVLGAPGAVMDYASNRNLSNPTTQPVIQENIQPTTETTTTTPQPTTPQATEGIVGKRTPIDAETVIQRAIDNQNRVIEDLQNQSYTYGTDVSQQMEIANQRLAHLNNLLQQEQQKKQQAKKDIQDRIEEAQRFRQMEEGQIPQEYVEQLQQLQNQPQADIRPSEPINEQSNVNTQPQAEITAESQINNAEPQPVTGEVTTESNAQESQTTPNKVTLRNLGEVEVIEETDNLVKVKNKLGTIIPIGKQAFENLKIKTEQPQTETITPPIEETTQPKQKEQTLPMDETPTEVDLPLPQDTTVKPANVEPKTYRYYTTQRPPSPGAQPSGATNIVSFDTKKIIDGVEAWGYVEYDKPLTAKQINDYELIEAQSTMQEDNANTGKTTEPKQADEKTDTKQVENIEENEEKRKEFEDAVEKLAKQGKAKRIKKPKSNTDRLTNALIDNEINEDNIEFAAPRAKRHGFDLRQRMQIARELIEGSKTDNNTITVNVYDDGTLEIVNNEEVIAQVLNSLGISKKQAYIPNKIKQHFKKAEKLYKDTNDNITVITDGFVVVVVEEDAVSTLLELRNEEDINSAKGRVFSRIDKINNSEDKVELTEVPKEYVVSTKNKKQKIESYVFKNGDTFLQVNKKYFDMLNTDGARFYVEKDNGTSDILVTNEDGSLKGLILPMRPEITNEDQYNRLNPATGKNFYSKPATKTTESPIKEVSQVTEQPKEQTIKDTENVSNISDTQNDIIEERGNVESQSIADVTKATNNGGVGGSPAFKGLSNWRRARKEGKITKIERPSDIIKSLEKDLKVPITKGKVTRPKALGMFKASPETIRTRVENDMPVVAHEIGHYFDKKYKFSKKGPIQEAVDLLPEEFRQLYKDEEIPGEAMAEFMREYLLNPDYAYEKMPTLYDYFEKTISKEELDILKNAAERIDSYMKLNEIDKTKAFIRSRLDVKENDTISEIADKLYTRIFDDLHPIENLVKIVEKIKGRKLIGSDNPYIMALNSRTVDLIAKQIVTENNVDSKGNVIGKSLKQILEPITNKKYGDFINYLVNKHAVEWLTPDENGNVKRVFADNTQNTLEAAKSKVEYYETMYPEFSEVANELYDFQNNIG